MQTIEDKWDEIKENIRREYDLSDVSFHTWVEPLRYFDVQDDTVSVWTAAKKFIFYTLSFINLYGIQTCFLSIPGIYKP